jgi:hypothetical protein
MGESAFSQGFGWVFGGVTAIAVILLLFAVAPAIPKVAGVVWNWTGGFLSGHLSLGIPFKGFFASLGGVPVADLDVPLMIPMWLVVLFVLFIVSLYIGVVHGRD